MIRVDKLYKHYDSGLVKALNGISFEVKKGEACAIMGPSGCGKSTLLNLLGALDEPTSGDIFIGDNKLNCIRTLSEYRNKQIGIVFQFHNLIPNISVEENVLLPTIANPDMNYDKSKKKCFSILSEMGLLKKIRCLPTEISGGERQRVAVARALINSPKILLADEPTGSVDSETADFIISYILNLNHGNKMTTILVTHNKEIAQRADRTIFMLDGKIIG